MAKYESRHTGQQIDDAVDRADGTVKLTEKVSIADIINATNSTAINKPLSANMGHELQEQINNLMARGRYLSLWNCVTGLPTDNPTTLPYNYKTGDYFIVTRVASATGEKNYRPSGSQYTGTVSVVEETEDVAVDDVYYYDGTHWALQFNTRKQITFINIIGDPYDNEGLANALNYKVSLNDNGNLVLGSTTLSEDQLQKLIALLDVMEVK